MINGKKVLAIIPARNGSKRLPGKNKKLLGGKPLILWTIESALNSIVVDSVIVSTNDPNIAAMASTFDNVLPLMRPEDLAQDDSTSIDVALHVLEHQKKAGHEEFGYVLFLQPTSPFRNAKHIDSACNLLIDKKADSIISVCEVDHSPLWMNTIPDDLSLNKFVDHNVVHKRSQDLPVYYRLNGAIYLVSIERFLKEKTFFIRDNVYAYKMPVEDSVDIDTEFDFVVAEAVFTAYY